jgi:hypothetical protein
MEILLPILTLAASRVKAQQSIHSNQFCLPCSIKFGRIEVGFTMNESSANVPAMSLIKLLRPLGKIHYNLLIKFEDECFTLIEKQLLIAVNAL